MYHTTVGNSQMLHTSQWSSTSVLLDPRKGRSYKITVVCLCVCVSATKINFVNFLKIGTYDFF